MPFCIGGAILQPNYIERVVLNTSTTKNMYWYYQYINEMKETQNKKQDNAEKGFKKKKRTLINWWQIIIFKQITAYWYNKDCKKGK